MGQWKTLQELVNVSVLEGKHAIQSLDPVLAKRGDAESIRGRRPRPCPVMDLFLISSLSLLHGIT